MKNKIEIKIGDKEWYQNGKLHRENGPAIEGADGHEEFWENGNLIKKKN